MMYNYYSFETDSAWDICAVRDFLQKKGLQTEDGYNYGCKVPFISISLLYIKNSSGWNSERDIYESRCNYIPVVTSDISDSTAFVLEVLDGLTKLTGAELKDEW